MEMMERRGGGFAMEKRRGACGSDLGLEERPARCDWIKIKINLPSIKKATPH